MAENAAVESAPAQAPAAPAASDSLSVVQPAAYETLSEDDQIIEDLKREHSAKVIAETPDEPVKAPTKPAKAKRGAKEEPAPPAAKEPAAAPASPSTVKYGTPDEAVSAIVAALESGDPKKIAKAIGKPEKFLEVTDAKWMAFREQQNAVRERDKQITTREHDYNEKVAGIRKEYGAAVKAAQAYREGRLSEFVTLVQELTGERYDDAQRKVIQGEIALDPNTKAMREEIAALKRERAAEKAELEKAKQTQTQQEQFQRAVDAVTADLASHRVSKVKGYQRDVLSRVRNSWDGSDYTMSFEEAADAIMDEKDAEAEALGYARAPALQAAPAPRQLPASTGTVPPRSRAADARPADKEPWEDPSQPDMTDDEILESIRRDLKSGRLK